MPASALPGAERSRLAVLLEHSARIDDPRDVRRITHPLPEVLLLVVCGTMADCDDYDQVLLRLTHGVGFPDAGWI